MSDDHRIGVDIGGTFTDCVVTDASGNVFQTKVPSTPADFSVGFLAALDAAAAGLGATAEELLASTTRLVHGTTAGINALVTGKVAKTALLTTKGHGDSIRLMNNIGRVRGVPVENVLDFAKSDRAAPVLERDSVLEIDERMDCFGSVVVPLNEEQVREIVRRLVEDRVEAVAISLLWSFKNADHERAIASIVQELAPDIFVSAAHEVAPRIGEYPRTVATVFNAQIGPMMHEYVQRLSDSLRQRGFRRDLLFALAEGGSAPAPEIQRLPLLTLQSGPVGGVIGTKQFAGECGYDNIVVTDMGGTTLDVAVIANGEIKYTEQSVIERQEVYLRRVDVESIGAGGGSIAWIDETDETLRVGPMSAGADPGPICYGRGGTAVTVTDADLVLGIFDPERPMPGGIDLDYDAAFASVEALGARLGVDAYECAAGIVEIVDSRMEDLVVRVTLQRGNDPRDFALFAYGGASGAHAGLFARGLGVRNVVFPMNDTASVWSAYGLNRLSPRRTFQTSLNLQSPFAVTPVLAELTKLEEAADRYLRGIGLDPSAAMFECRAEMKYAMQYFEVEVELPDPRGPDPTEWSAALIDRFERRYTEFFGPGTGYRGAGVVMTALKLTASEPDRDGVDHSPIAPTDAARSARARRVYWIERRAQVETPVLWGPTLPHDARVPGPAIVEYPHTTIAVRPGQDLRVDPAGSLVLDLEAAQLAEVPA